MATSKPTKTLKALLHSTALLFALCLLIQIPIVAEYGHQPFAWLNLLIHLMGAFMVVYLCKIEWIALARTTLLICYFSYVVSAVLIWQKDVYIQHFLLLGSVCSVFLFTQQERYARLLWGLAYAIAFCVLDIKLSFALPSWEGAIRRGNSVTLAIACASVIITLHYHTRKKWLHLSNNYRLTKGLLAKITPASQFLTARNAYTRQHVSVACVLFADIKGYQKLTTLFDESLILDHLDAFYCDIDKQAKRHNLCPIKTNGDEYMAASGLGINKSWHDQHINQTVMFALYVISAFTAFASRHQWPCQIRIGIAAGPITAGMPKRHHGAFDVWGKTVNLASMLEQSAQPNAIVIADTVYAGISKKNKQYFLPVEVATKVGNLNAFHYCDNRKNKREKHVSTHSNEHTQQPSISR